MLAQRWVPTLRLLHLKEPLKAWRGKQWRLCCVLSTAEIRIRDFQETTVARWSRLTGQMEMNQWDAATGRSISSSLDRSQVTDSYDKINLQVRTKYEILWNLFSWIIHIYLFGWQTSSKDQDILGLITLCLEIHTYIIMYLCLTFIWEVSAKFMQMSF